MWATLLCLCIKLDGVGPIEADPPPAKGEVKKNTSIYPHLWISVPPPLSTLADFIIIL